MKAHTTGPWEAVDRLTVRGAYVAGDPLRDGSLVATLPPSCADGDAALIAEAPELLTVLKDVLRMARTMSGQFGTTGHGPRFERAEAAIARAEGRA